MWLSATQPWYAQYHQKKSGKGGQGEEEEERRKNRLKATETRDLSAPEISPTFMRPPYIFLAHEVPAIFIKCPELLLTRTDFYTLRLKLPLLEYLFPHKDRVFISTPTFVLLEDFLNMET